MTKTKFFEIFKNHQIDEEWAQIIFDRFLEKYKSIEEITDDEVIESAISWKKYADEGGF